MVVPRIEREDAPGSWHHIYHRGVSRRSVFEERADLRHFLAHVARAVRRGELEVHAFCLMTNHFHMLARSPAGRLSQAMKRILNAFVRRFNRTRGRDGSLFAHRFRSKVVGSRAYRRILVPYIDANPLKPGLADRPAEYPWGSARHYARAEGPIWLTRSWIESEVCASARETAYRPEDYAASFGRPPSEAVAAWVLRRLERDARPAADAALDDMLGAAPDKVRAWLVERARLADGMNPGHSLVPADWVEGLPGLRVPDLAGEALCARSGGPAQRARSVWDLAVPGLLRHLAGLSQQEIALRLGLPRTTVQHRLLAHASALRHDRAYANTCALLSRELLDRINALVV